MWVAIVVMLHRCLAVGEQFECGLLLKYVGHLAIKAPLTSASAYNQPMHPQQRDPLQFYGACVCSWSTSPTGGRAKRNATVATFACSVAILMVHVSLLIKMGELKAPAIWPIVVL